MKILRKSCGWKVNGKLTDWLAADVAHAEQFPDRVREELLKHCCQKRIEPPSPGQDT
ncbi:hypothetical protein [Nonomuraea sp. NPDC049400]|uniref:hypothetical protein n=1 Tax=Nonomuraea sp. NPDC049400 TaxID=3364352 RepID=UPI003793A751